MNKESSNRDACKDLFFAILENEEEISKNTNLNNILSDHRSMNARDAFFTMSSSIIRNHFAKKYIKDSISLDDAMG